MNPLIPQLYILKYLTLPKKFLWNDTLMAVKRPLKNRFTVYEMQLIAPRIVGNVFSHNGSRVKVVVISVVNKIIEAWWYFQTVIPKWPSYGFSFKLNVCQAALIMAAAIESPDLHISQIPKVWCRSLEILLFILLKIHQCSGNQWP